MHHFIQNSAREKRGAKCVITLGSTLVIYVVFVGKFIFLLCKTPFFTNLKHVLSGKKKLRFFTSHKYTTKFILVVDYLR